MNKFIDGLSFKEPHQNAPDFIKAKGSIKRNDLIGFLQKQTQDWINFDVKVSKNGKWYCSIDEWKKEEKDELTEHMNSVDEPGSDLPF